MNGFLLIDKPATWTSRDVCNRIQHLFHTKKVGHTGTLDPFATGLLIVTLGNATKAGLYLENEDKEYIAELKLGTNTTTGDFTGDVLGTKDIPNLTIESINKVLFSMLGKQIQIPPMTSARHYKGQQLYKLAHQGITVERQGKEIEIKEISFISYKNNVLTFKCRVSKGTYIRVLGEDIAIKLGTVGHLTNLRRTMIGSASVKNAKSLDEVSENDIKEITPFLEKSYKTFVADEELEKKVRTGINIDFDAEEQIIFIKSKTNNALAIYEKNEIVINVKEGFGRMKTIYFDYKTVPTIQDSFSLCLGYFDGVHIGHQSMINAAAKEGYKIGLLTFDVSPSYILGKFNKNIYLTSVSDKEEILSRMGVDYLFVLKFDEECMNLSYEDFLNCVILKLKPKCVFCGSDYRFGKNGSGDFNVLSKKIKTNVVPFLKINDEKVSSSAIFNFLENGDIKSANSFLGREYRIHGIVQHGLQNGKKIGFPTANIKAQSYALPGDGVYQTKTIIDGVTFDSITNVGNHPTIDPLDEKIIETYILNINDIDIYGKDIYLLFIEKIRNQHQFDTINDLVNQIEKDKEFVTNKIKK